MHVRKINISSNIRTHWFTICYIYQLLHVSTLRCHSQGVIITKIYKPTCQSRLFQITNLMHNSFIFQQYVCYTTLLNIFRAARCSSSGGPIVSPQPLVSSPSVSSRTVRRWRADCSPAYCTAAYRGWRYQRLWWYNWSSWGWAACCSKHVEERSVTYILLKNKWIAH